MNLLSHLSNPDPATWRQQVADNLYLSDWDRHDGVGTRTVVRMGETPRLQEIPEPVPASSLEHEPVSILPTETGTGVGWVTVTLVVGVGFLAGVIGWMGGAA